MSRPKVFENILDECLERLLVRGESPEQCLQDYPEYADELKPLLETALLTTKAADIQPDTDFRERARYEFYSAVGEAAERKSRPFFRRVVWQPRLVTALVIPSY